MCRYSFCKYLATLGRLGEETGRGAQEGAPWQPQDLPNPPRPSGPGSWGPGVLGLGVLGPIAPRFWVLGPRALGSCVLGPGLVSWVLWSWVWVLGSCVLALPGLAGRPGRAGCQAGSGHPRPTPRRPRTSPTTVAPDPKPRSHIAGNKARSAQSKPSQTACIPKASHI